MRQYLEYLKRYCQVALAPDARLDDFIDSPMFIWTWHEPKVDVTTWKFGIMFRIFDGFVELSNQDLRVLVGQVESSSDKSLGGDWSSPNRLSDYKTL